MVQPHHYRLNNRRLLAWLALIASLAITGCGVPNALPPQHPPPRYSVAQPGELPKRIDIPLREHNGYLRIPARINGYEAGLFLFDTGSSRNAVTPTMANTLNLPYGRVGIATGIAGQEAYRYRHVHTLSIADLALKASELASLDLYRFNRSFGGSMGGLIGFGAFGGLPFTIDYQASTLTVYSPAWFEPPAGASGSRLWVYRGVPMVQATVGDGHEVWLILDTGADQHAVLPQSCLTQWPDIVLVPNTGVGRSQGVGGSIASVKTWLRSIRIFDQTLNHMPVSFEPDRFTHLSENRVIGRVGSQLLKQFQLTLDATNQRVWAQQRPGS